MRLDIGISPSLIFRNIDCCQEKFEDIVLEQKVINSSFVVLVSNEIEFFVFQVSSN